MFCRQDSSFVSNLVFLHELSHAMMSVNYYGSFIAFLKLVSIDLLIHWAVNDKTTNFASYWEIVQSNQKLISRMNQSWIVLHEGLATFEDWLFLEKAENAEKDQFVKVLETLLTKDTPYTYGFNLLKQLYEHVQDVASVKKLLRQIANVDIFTDGASIFSNEFSVYVGRVAPDKILQLLIRSLNGIHTDKVRRLISPPEHRKFLRLHLNQDVRFIHFENSPTDILEHFLSRIYGLNGIPETYNERIDKIRERHRDHESNVRWTSSLFYFPAERRNLDGTGVVTKLLPGIYQNGGDREIVKLITNEIELLCHVDALAERFLPDNPALFQYHVSTHYGQLSLGYYYLFQMLFPITSEYFEQRIPYDDYFRRSQS